jgi:hypothetical protein
MFMDWTRPKKRRRGTTLTWHIGLLELITEDDLVSGNIVSVLDEQLKPMMIFMSAKKDGIFEVKVHKADPAVSYIPHPSDVMVTKYKSNDKHAIFTFDTFLAAKLFLIGFQKNHPEYSVRPVITT